MKGKPGDGNVSIQTKTWVCGASVTRDPGVTRNCATDCSSYFMIDDGSSFIRSNLPALPTYGIKLFPDASALTLILVRELRMIPQYLLKSEVLRLLRSHSIEYPLDFYYPLKAEPDATQAPDMSSFTEALSVVSFNR